LKIQDGGGRYLEKVGKSPYLGNGLTDNPTWLQVSAVAGRPRYAVRRASVL